MGAKGAGRTPPTNPSWKSARRQASGRGTSQSPRWRQRGGDQWAEAQRTHSATGPSRDPTPGWLQSCF
eukprot:15437743-Alexandrium_andersonii.AAC.1